MYLEMSTVIITGGICIVGICLITMIIYSVYVYTFTAVYWCLTKGDNHLPGDVAAEVLIVDGKRQGSVNKILQMP